MKLPRNIDKVIWSTLWLVLFASCSSPVEYNLSYSWSPVKINTEIEQSNQVESIIEPYRSKLDSMMNEVIGYAAHDLTTNGRYESTLGTFVTELLYEQSNSLYKRTVDVAIMNHHGGLRAPINEGPVTLGEVFEVMPFENEMLLLEVPGDKLIEVIEFVGNSSSSMIWPVSFEVSKSGIDKIRVNGEDIDLDKTYILSVSDYQANGGSGFEMLKSLKRLDVTPIKLRDMIVTEIRELTAQGDTIKTEVANLITISNR